MWSCIVLRSMSLRSVLILRSARAECVQQDRTDVRASRRMGRPPISGLPEIGIIECASRQQPTCGARAHASRRIAANAAMLLSMRSGEESPPRNHFADRAGVVRGEEQ